MKKSLFFIVLVFIMDICSLSAYNLENIYGKIDKIYDKSPEEIEELNIKILKIKEHNSYNIKMQEVVNDLYSYTNYKLKNKAFYNQEIPDSVKKSLKNISDASITDQDIILKFNDFLGSNKLSYIEKEFVEYSMVASQIWILLNHQDFQWAEKKATDFFWNNSNKVNFLLKNTNYKDYVSLIQLFSFINTEKRNEMIEFRITMNPGEKNTGYHMWKINGHMWSDCNTYIIKNIHVDLIEEKICKLTNWYFEEGDILELKKLNNLQDLSDRAIYYFLYSIKYWSNKKIDEDMLALGKKIIELDKNFVNGYIILMDYYNKKEDCINYNKYLDLLEENYIWDDERKIIIFDARKIEYCYGK